MDERQCTELAGWLVEAGLAGESESALLTGFCGRAVAGGLALARARVLVDTLHPIYEGRVFRWMRDRDETEAGEYGRSDQGEALASWRRSPFYHLDESGEAMLRRRVNAESAAEFPALAEFLDDGMTDYLALVSRFSGDSTIGEMECVYTSWVTDSPQGFSAADLDALQRFVPLLALGVKAASLGRIAETLVETYLGRDAGRRVLSGRIARGVADRIEAVLWFSDLRGYTRITDTAEPEQIIPLLNDYADAVISAIHAERGDVLKLMGDGILAIFTTGGRERACRGALAAAVAAQASVDALNRRRAAEGLPVTEIYLGLHVGEVFYGNIGSKERLDFTVVGPAVNEVSRIAAMCRSVDQPVLVSSDFAQAVGDSRRRFLSVGRFALRGIHGPQELFTLDPTSEPQLAGLSGQGREQQTGFDTDEHR
ncbi:MAG: adenylate/guanylate cyclase domain-containing protein [Kiloniellales bacterium]